MAVFSRYSTPIQTFPLRGGRGKRFDRNRDCKVCLAFAPSDVKMLPQGGKMKKILSAKAAGNIVAVVMSLFIIFNILIISGLIPYNRVWGGMIKDADAMIKFEVVTMLILSLFLTVILLQTHYTKPGLLRNIAGVFTWIIFGYLLLNTVLNLLSGVTVEKLVFTPITIILALLVLRLAVDK
jgi:hypothetical protein